jgi:hypothetical protein
LDSILNTDFSTLIGQIPTGDGLFELTRLAYLSAEQLDLTFLKACVEFVVP